jgi:hypothetical protein
VTVVVLVGITVVKLVLAALTGGTADIGQQLSQAEAYLSGRDFLDPASTGHNPSFFPLGHYMIAAAALWISRLTSTPFAFWIKAPAVLSDLAVSVLLQRSPRGGNGLALAYMTSPLPILLSVYHGQLHTVAAFGGLAAVWLAVDGHRNAAAAVLALAASVRQHFAVFMVPLLARSDARERVFATAVFIALAAVINAPLVTSAHPDRVLAPTWTYGVWGYTVVMLQGPRLLALMGIREAAELLASLNEAVLRRGVVFYWIWAAVYCVWAWRRPTVDLWRAVLLFLLGFYVVSPGFGVQWLIWALPFWLLVDRRAGMTYGFIAGAFAAGLYWVSAINAKYGVMSVTANLGVLDRYDLATYVIVGGLGVVTWLQCARAAWRLVWAHSPSAVEEHPSPARDGGAGARA